MTADLACQELVELVTAYLEDTLPQDVRRRFDAHLEGCDGCSTYLEQMRQTVAWTGSLRTDDVDPVMMQRLLVAFRDWHGTGDRRSPGST